MSLIEALKKIPDHRGRQGREYPLHALLGLCVVAILSGRKGLRSIARYGQDYPEVLQPLGFKPHKPYQLAHTTLQRMLKGLDMTQLARVLGEQLGEIGAVQTLVLDGKRLRGSQDAPLSPRSGESGARGLHLLEAFVAEGKRILGGVQVEQDEAAEVGRLLEGLGLGELRGVVVIGDAAFAERAVAQRVLDKGGITSSS
ncbi:MAG: hypothetical protein C4327_10845 [Meiothermus sp.]